MTRQDQLKEIGNMHLTAYTSKFIIPVPHRFYTNQTSVFKDLEGLGWQIENKTKGVKLNAYNIKSYIYDNMIPELAEGGEQTFLDTSSTLLLKHDTEDLKVMLHTLEGKDYELIVKEIHLWVFEENIAFFVFHIDIENRDRYSINEINKINNILRSFKFLDVKKEIDHIALTQRKMIEGEKKAFLNYLLELTQIREGYKSFLNIEACDCTEKSKKNKINELYSIYNTSANAKLLLGMQTEATQYSDGSDIEVYSEECITFHDEKEMSILSELPYYLATCTSMEPSKGWTSNDGYIYRLVNEGGFNVWKYSSGLIIHDSAAFIGLKDDGGSVVDNVESNFYFIYMLNLYINFQTKQIAHELIDQHFEARDINYWYKKLQKLKNQFVSDDIGIKFQENELNKSMLSALKTKELLSEVSSNIVETKSITKSHTGIYVTLLGFVFIYLLEGQIKEFFSHIDKLYLFMVAVPVAAALYVYRHKIRKRFKL